MFDDEFDAERYVETDDNFRSSFFLYRDVISAIIKGINGLYGKNPDVQKKLQTLKEKLEYLQKLEENVFLDYHIYVLSPLKEYEAKKEYGNFKGGPKELGFSKYLSWVYTQFRLAYERFENETDGFDMALVFADKVMDVTELLNVIDDSITTSIKQLQFLKEIVNYTGDEAAKHDVNLAYPLLAREGADAEKNKF